MRCKVLLASRVVYPVICEIIILIPRVEPFNTFVFHEFHTCQVFTSVYDASFAVLFLRAVIRTPSISERASILRNSVHHTVEQLASFR